MHKTGLALLIVMAAIAAAGMARADECAALRARLSALEAADRAEWEAPGRSGDPYAVERERRAVHEALAARRCVDRVAERRPGRIGRVFSGLFGKGLFRGDRARPDRGPSGDGVGPGPYRTLCVRRCDGYYFPISFAAAGRELKRDAAACRALCPGQDVALYLQRSGGDGGPSVSLAGEPYSALPTAFRYRSEYDRACGCGPVDASLAAAFQAFSVPPPDAAIVTGTVAAAGLPTPRARPTGADPETAQNRAGRFAPGGGVAARGDSTVYGRGVDGQMVRLVGPADGYLAE